MILWRFSLGFLAIQIASLWHDPATTKCHGPAISHTAGDGVEALGSDVVSRGLFIQKRHARFFEIRSTNIAVLFAASEYWHGQTLAEIIAAAVAMTRVMNFRLWDDDHPWRWQCRLRRVAPYLIDNGLPVGRAFRLGNCVVPAMCRT